MIMNQMHEFYSSISHSKCCLISFHVGLQCMAKALIMSSIITSKSEYMCINASLVSLSSIIVLFTYILRCCSEEMVHSTSHVVTGSTARMVSRCWMLGKMTLSKFSAEVMVLGTADSYNFWNTQFVPVPECCSRRHFQ